MIPPLILLLSLSQSRVNPDSALVVDFQNRVSDYVRLTAKLKSDLPLKPSDSRAVVTHREAEFAGRIQQARPQAAQGDIFTPRICAEFRRLIGIAMQGPEAQRIRKSLEHAEPVQGQLRVNAPYPSVPLQSTPPSLLLNLPPLPSEVDYRLVGRALVLRDVQANLIVDFVPNAIP
jgi:hypothetical protein